MQRTKGKHKELRERMRHTCHSIKNINKQIGSFKKKQIEILQLQSKTFTRGAQQEITLTEGGISNHEYRSIEIIQPEKENEQGINKNNRAL